MGKQICPISICGLPGTAEAELFAHDYLGLGLTVGYWAGGLCGSGWVGKGWSYG